MADSGVGMDWMTYLKSFAIGGITAYLFYLVADRIDMGYLSPGAPTAALGGGLAAVVAPMIMSKIPGMSMAY